MAGLEGLALRDEGARPDQAAFADKGPVQHPRAHADQRAVGDGAAVEDRLVADRHAPPDGERRMGIAVADGPVLDVAFFTDEDRCVVGPDYGPEPDAGAGAEANVADEIGGWRGPAPLGEGGRDRTEGIEWHGRDDRRRRIPRKPLLCEAHFVV